MLLDITNNPSEDYIRLIVQDSWKRFQSNFATQQQEER